MLLLLGLNSEYTDMLQINIFNYLMLCNLKFAIVKYFEKLNIKLNIN